jgi:hypothetical protein
MMCDVPSTAVFFVENLLNVITILLLSSKVINELKYIIIIIITRYFSENEV